VSVSKRIVKVANGKYEFVHLVPRATWLAVYRGGDSLCPGSDGHNDAIVAIMAELDAARAVLAAVRADRDGGVPTSMDVQSALELHDRLVDDREPPSAWCGAPPEATQTAEPGWIPPSQRVPEPGPCTPMAHSWVSGSAVCRCGEATRTGDCRFWGVASRLTGAQIYEAITGRPKPAKQDCSCAGGDAGGHDMDCEWKQ